MASPIRDTLLQRIQALPVGANLTQGQKTQYFERYSNKDEATCDAVQRFKPNNQDLIDDAVGLFPQTAPADNRTLTERFTSLVQSADPRLKVNRHVILRCVRRFPQHSLAYVTGQDKDQAKTLYEDTERLPQTATEQKLNIDGYQINGSLSTGNDTLVMCFNQNSVPCVLKTLNTRESERIVDLPALNSPHIIKYELRRSTRENLLMIMPLLPATLEHITQLSPAQSVKLWKHMSDALSCLHQHGLAHMDVKPSNICLDHAGNFILIDLGSVVQFGQKSASTPAYIPVGLNPDLARPTVDWWMLAATLGERGCRMEEWGSGAANPTRKDLVLKLEHLPCSADILLMLEKHKD